MTRRHPLRFFSNLNIRKKMLFVLLPVLLVFVGCMTFIYRFMLGDLQDNLIENNYRILSLVENDIRQEFAGIRPLTSSLISNDYVKEYVTPGSPALARERLQARMTRNFYRDMDAPYTNNLNTVMVIVDEWDFVYNYAGAQLTPRERQLLAAYVCEAYAGGYTGAYLSPPAELGGRAGCLCCVLPITDGSSFPQRAYLLVTLNRSLLANVAAKYYAPNSSLTISDREGNAVWRSSTLSASELAELPEPYPENGWRIGRAEAGEVLVMNTRIEDMGWLLTLQTPLSSIQSQLGTYQLVFWPITAAGCLVSLAALYFASEIILRRVREMNGVIADIRGGDLDSRFPVRYSDEISQIGGEFNRMIDQVQYLRLNAAEQKLKQREAELRALQSQINPHFLYNTLESIRMVAQVNSDDTAARQIKLLSDMFRYTTHFNALGDMVTVRQEAEHVGVYLSLQKFRFGEKLTVSTELDSELMDCRMLKLVLQPIVENALVHGLRAVGYAGRVEIAGRLEREGSLICFTVTDNGAGMEPERLDALCRALAASPYEERIGGSIGLLNVNDRIRLRFGESYGITVAPRPEGGLIVRITMPAVRDEPIDPPGKEPLC